MEVDACDMPELSRWNGPLSQSRLPPKMRRSCLSIENDPTIFLGVVLGHFFHAWKAGGREIIQLNDCGLRVDHVQTSGV